MSEKEKLFCFLYSRFPNVKLCAIQAGFPKISAYLTGQKILQKQDALDLINKYHQNQPSSPDLSHVLLSLNQLAFATPNDCVKLALLCKHSDDFNSVINKLDQLDLSLLSELKLLKDGAVEMKFIDRFKINELLSSLANLSQNDDSSLEFYSAIAKGASAINNSFDGADDEI